MRNYSASSWLALSLLFSGPVVMLAAVEGPSAVKTQDRPEVAPTISPKPTETPASSTSQTKASPKQQPPGQVTTAEQPAQKTEGTLKAQPSVKREEDPKPKASPPQDIAAGDHLPANPTPVATPQKPKEPTSKEEKKNPPQRQMVAKIDPFTGKITKNKVRIRLQSTVDAGVLREINLNDLVVVVGEADDFYAIQPPEDVKAYVYRTFVLDNVIEGNRVNARLKPDLEAPVVAQLNSGDRVEGTIHPANNKWMEIKLPAGTRFYIAKEYVSKAGDAGFKARQEKKHAEAIQILNVTPGLATAELAKPFDQINIDPIKANYEHLIKDYPEFPEVGTKAKEALVALQEAYVTKKLSHLETQTRNSANTFEANKKLSVELQAQKSKVNQLEKQLEQDRQMALAPKQQPSTKPDQLPVHMSAWLPFEENLMATWTERTGKHNPKEFYDEQKRDSFTLKGVVDVYTRPVKNKPGDFMLVNSSSKLPIAFLYSTIVNLHDYVGHEVSITVTSRPNNHFAFPAYFVLQLQ